MNAHDRAVDHLHFAVVGLHDGIHHAIPDAGFAPADEPVVNGGIGAVTLGQISPGAARAQNVEHAVEDLPVVLRLRPPAVHGNKGSMTFHSESVRS